MDTTEFIFVLVHTIFFLANIVFILHYIQTVTWLFAMAIILIFLTLLISSYKEKKSMNERNVSLFMNGLAIVGYNILYTLLFIASLGNLDSAVLQNWYLSLSIATLVFSETL